MITLKVEGGDKLAATLRDLPNRVSRSIQREALATGAEVIRQRVAASAPREPGTPDLASNILVQKDVRPGDGSVGVGIGVPRGFFYDWFNEFGTVKQSARPFWRPAFDSEKERVIKLVASEMWAALIRKGSGSGRGSGGGTGL
jgi:HK97 gp10 family phage protein